MQNLSLPVRSHGIENMKIRPSGKLLTQPTVRMGYNLVRMHLTNF